MYIILTLFFVSLVGIIFMIGRKLILLQNGNALEQELGISEEQYLEELRHSTLKGVKIFGFVILVGLIRLHVKFSNFFKTQYQQIIIKIKSAYEKRYAKGAKEAREVSKFLRMIGEYKHKIRRIKEKVKEEEQK